MNCFLKICIRFKNFLCCWSCQKMAKTFSGILHFLFIKTTDYLKEKKESKMIVPYLGIISAWQIRKTYDSTKTNLDVTTPKFGWEWIWTSFHYIVIQGLPCIITSSKACKIIQTDLNAWFHHSITRMINLLSRI